MNDRSDGELIARSRRGERGAYAVLVTRHSRRVFAICLAVLGNIHDAEDAAQDTLFKGFAELSKLRNDGRFSAWIGRIARNVCIDVLRRRRGKDASLGEHVVSEQRADSECPDLQAAIIQLPEEYRVALMHYYFDGQSAKSVAETLGISEGAVYTRLSRARQGLRKLLAEQGDA